jgi:hypothetical protein
VANPPKNANPNHVTAWNIQKYSIQRENLHSFCSVRKKVNKAPNLTILVRKISPPPGYAMPPPPHAK